MRILVTGADGFVGRHLCDYLRKQGDQVTEAVGPNSNLSGKSLRVNVADAKDVLAAFRAARPEAVVNLAGFSSVAKSSADPASVFQVNTQGTLNILGAAKEIAPKARILLVGSGEMYGVLPVEMSATEDMPLLPLGPYGLSKAAAELAGRQFHRAHGLEVVMARPFNHLGRGQHSDFVVPILAKQIQAIRHRAAEPVIKVGNLHAVRDFHHVDDTVAAYRLLLTRGQAGNAYNVCSGNGRTIRSLLDEMLTLSGVDARVEVDPSRLRPNEITWLVGNPRRIRELGWREESSVTQALKEVLNEQRATE